jgi:hypothetical protein
VEGGSDGSSVAFEHRMERQTPRKPAWEAVFRDSTHS